MRPSLLNSLGGALAIAAIACGDGGPAADGAAIRDSAGITIVENTAPLWNDGSAWEVSATPSLTIGVVDGEAEYQLFRASGVFALSDGRIAVANNGTSEVRYYTRDGAFLMAAGGRGEGPGEFQSMAWARVTTGDTIMVFEADGSVSLFDENAKFVSVVTLQLGLKFSREYVAQFSDGRYLAMHRPEPSLEEYMTQPTGVSRVALLALSVDPSGIVRDTLGVFPHYKYDTQLRDVPVKGRSPIQWPVWFAPQAVTVAFADSFYVGTGETYEIGLYDARGVLRRLVRRSYEPRRVTQTDIARGIEHYTRVWGGAKFNTAYTQAQLRWIADTPAEEFFPPYQLTLLADADRNLWVERFEPQRWYEGLKTGYPMRFDVFDPAGRYLGIVEMPDNFEPTDIGKDYLLGLWEDEVEVQYALKYDIIKPESAD